MKNFMAVKFVDGKDDVIEGLILPYGGPASGRDLTGTFFTKETDFCLDWFPEGGRPGLYRHGFDPATKSSVIGREVGGRDDDKGHWLQAQLDASHEYMAEIRELVDQGKLFLSSGAVDHLTDVSVKSGEIYRWPWVEWSLTPRPANPDQPAVREQMRNWPGYAVKSLDAIEHLAVLGVAVPSPVKDRDQAPSRSLAVRALKDFSESASDASSGSYALSSLIGLLSDESNEAHGGLLRTAITAVLKWLAGEIDEIGTPVDTGIPPTITEVMTTTTAYLEAVREGKRNSGSDASLLGGAHDAIASVLDMDCAPDATKETARTPHGLAIPASTSPATVSDDAMAAIRRDIEEHARSVAQQALGRSN